jgi:hypothetical protein
VSGGNQANLGGSGFEHEANQGGSDVPGSSLEAQQEVRVARQTTYVTDRTISDNGIFPGAE